MDEEIGEENELDLGTGQLRQPFQTFFILWQAVVFPYLVYEMYRFYKNRDKKPIDGMYVT